MDERLGSRCSLSCTTNSGNANSTSPVDTEFFSSPGHSPQPFSSSLSPALSLLLSGVPSVCVDTFVVLLLAWVPKQASSRAQKELGRALFLGGCLQLQLEYSLKYCLTSLRQIRKRELVRRLPGLFRISSIEEEARDRQPAKIVQRDAHVHNTAQSQQRPTLVEPQRLRRSIWACDQSG